MTPTPPTPPTNQPPASPHDPSLTPIRPLPTTTKSPPAAPSELHGEGQALAAQPPYPTNFHDLPNPASTDQADRPARADKDDLAEVVDQPADSAGQVGLTDSDGRGQPADQADPTDLGEVVVPSKPADVARPSQAADLGDPADAPCRAVEEAALLADVRRASREVAEYLGRRRARVGRAADGWCLCQGGASDDRPGSRLRLVEVDPLDVGRQEGRGRLGAILGHCRCEPGAVAA